MLHQLNPPHNRKRPLRRQHLQEYPTQPFKQLSACIRPRRPQLQRHLLLVKSQPHFLIPKPNLITTPRPTWLESSSYSLTLEGSSAVVRLQLLSDGTLRMVMSSLLRLVVSSLRLNDLLNDVCNGEIHLVGMYFGIFCMMY